jgi:hypothetical protein
MSAFGDKVDIEAGTVQRRDHGPRQRAIAALRAHSWRCSLVELSTRAWSNDAPASLNSAIAVVVSVIPYPIRQWLQLNLRRGLRQ